MTRAATAETYRPAYTLLNSVPGRDFGLFGSGVALGGGRVIVGVPGLDAGPFGEIGRVDVFDLASGMRVWSIADPSGLPENGFGRAVAAVGGSVLIGAPLAAGGGAAYLVDGSGALLHTFTSPSGAPMFGGFVGTLGGDILIGSKFFNGGAEVFDAGTYAHLRSLPGAFTILTTAATDLITTSSYGQAALRDGTTGAVVRTFADPVSGGVFPGAGAVVGGTLWLGDASEDGQELAEGAVYGFDLATGALLYTLHPPDTYETFSFGAPLATAGTTLFVSAIRGGEDGDGEVIAYQGSTVVDELYPPHPPRYGDLSTARDFGAALAVDGDHVVVGTPQDGRSGGVAGVAHVFDRCGDGARAAGEECDDGNTADGDGCSATCRLEACGVGPRNGCRVASRSQLVLMDPYVVYNIKAKLRWKWAGGSFDAVDVGDPTTDATFVLCVYGEGASPVTQVATLAGGTCGAKPCWTSAPGRVAIQYRNETLMPDGTRKLRLRSSSMKGKIQLDGLGETLGIPDRSCPDCPLPYFGTVTAQLVDSATGACWTSTFPTGTYSNAKGTLKASY